MNITIFEWKRLRWSNGLPVCRMIGRWKDGKAHIWKDSLFLIEDWDRVREENELVDDERSSHVKGNLWKAI